MAWSKKASVSVSAGWKPLIVMAGRVMVPSRGQVTFKGTERDPDAIARFEVRQGVPVCVGVEVRPSPNGRPLRASDFDEFRVLDGMARRVFRELAYVLEHDHERGESSGQPLVESEEQLQWELERAFVQGMSRKRPPPRDELEAVARVYNDADRAPIEAVRRERGYSRRTAARRIADARAAGLIPASSKET